MTKIAKKLAIAYLVSFYMKKISIECALRIFISQGAN